MAKRKYGSPLSPKATQLLLSKHTRMSQACDRCRLKKIKCDGIKPTCTPCTKIGFHCQTSDKLSRRGFPRGYTEMLEKEVVRLQQRLVRAGYDPSDNTEVSVSQNAASGAEADNSESFAGETSGRSNALPSGATSAEPSASVQPSSESHKQQLFHLPFINDTFHLHENRVAADGRFLGHATWNDIAGTMDKLPTETMPNDDEWLCRYLVRQFQLSQHRIPAALLIKYHSNAGFCKKRIRKCITHFLQTSMSLVPILNSSTWEERLFKINESKNTHPAALLTYLFIIQWRWSCFSDEKLFAATKIVVLNSTQPLLRLQCLLLACYYFMGTPSMSLLYNTSTAPYASQLLRLSFAEMINLGLFINSHRLVPLQNSPLNHSERLITFWCFQFLDSWWTLLQGTPKSNFTMDEFLPPKISSLRNPRLKPFELLIDFVVGCLDGCNLLYALSQGANTHMIFELESFRKRLFQYSLYHHLKDHDYHNLSTLATCVDKPQAIEIQLTLHYLIITFFANLKAARSTGRSSAKAAESLRDASYEILTLYYLIVVDSYDLKASIPQQLQALHLLPCDNLAIVNMCLECLSQWAVASESKGASDPEYRMSFEKHRSIVKAWCKIWYFDEPEDELLTQLQRSYQFSSQLPSGRSGQLAKLQYLNVMRTHNRRSLLLNLPDDTQVHENVGSLNTLGAESTQFRIPAADSANNLFESLAIQEEDEGYAEDDDDDDDTPLELPFFKKKRSIKTAITQTPCMPIRSRSLFDQHHPGPIIRRQSDAVAVNNGRLFSGIDESHLKVLKDSSVQKEIENAKLQSEHYLLVQGFQKSPPEVDTPRSLADILSLSGAECKFPPNSGAIPEDNSHDKQQASVDQT
ncbi:LAQU0S01e13212g1_1 [Lachancea quebecensis]|uniref:LAQU0S01e13212g1_1 n=1 Tax=Lachancea quebecensis TaxID=1654605 RepID=A0A0P1KMJ5_9SACH|nr:LAQU0S01e13212g1_1 [Lachancea quebecensis]